MIRTIKLLLLLLGVTLTYAASINSERQDTSNFGAANRNNTIEVAEGVKISSDSPGQLGKPVHNDLTSTSSAPSPVNATASTNETQMANSTSSSNGTLSTSSTTTTTTTTAVPPRLLINFEFPPKNSTITTEKVIPVNEIEVGEKNDHKMSVAKKGFRVNETEELFSSSSTSTTTTTTPRPKKPTLTIGNDDTVDNNATRITANANTNLSAASRKTDYIVPIVGVILSVPLVAILMNLVYRKSKDWWQYRHYKRMDLIDGIYNN